MRSLRSHQRRFILWLVVSIAAHTALFTLTKMKPPELVMAGSTPEKVLNVQIMDIQPASPPEAATPKAAPEPTPSPPPPRPVPIPPMPVPRITRKSPTGTEPPPPPPQPTQPPLPLRPPPIPEMDMAAMIEARRAARNAQRESQQQAAAPRPNMPPTPDQLAQSNIQRNLMMDRGGGVGGVFQILRKSTSSGEFAFNGWRPDTERRWREVIEVTTPPGGDIERAMVRRMIELIRGHYTGDFRWESHYLGRVIVLSARPEDQAGLEDFLMREFFDTPMERKPSERAQFR